MPQRRNIQNPTSPVYQSASSLGPYIARVGRVGAVLVVLLGLSVAPSWATDSQAARDSLRGLPGVNVLIEDLKPEVERAGLTKTQLQTDVELRLRQSEIRVLTKQEQRSVIGQPYVYVNVNVLLGLSGLAVYSIKVELCQKASLETGEIRYGATTWDVAMLGAIDRARLAQIRDKVRDPVDQFINAYLSVNPRPTGSPAPAPARWYDVLPEKPPPAHAAPPAPAPQPTRRSR